MSSMKVDTPFLAALGLIGVGLYGLGFNAGRRDTDEEFISREEYTKHHELRMKLDDKRRKRINELEERLDTRLRELEKRAGIPTNPLAP